MGHCGRGLQDQTKVPNVVNEGSAPQGSEKSRDSIRNWARDHLCYVLAKNLAQFYLCAGSLSDLNLAEDFPGQHVGCGTVIACCAWSGL